MKVSFIRFNSSALCQCFVVSSGESHFVRFTNYTVGTCQWSSGSRNRTRHFKDAEGVRKYLVKLFNGGWLSLNDYDSACVDLQKLEVYVRESAE